MHQIAINFSKSFKVGHKHPLDINTACSRLIPQRSIIFFLMDYITEEYFDLGIPW